MVSARREEPVLRRMSGQMWRNKHESGQKYIATSSVFILLIYNVDLFIFIVYLIYRTSMSIQKCTNYYLFKNVI
jgi:hypothetical protein